MPRKKINALKTLNEIPISNVFDRNKFSVREGITELIDRRILKQEAIKHITTCQNREDFSTNNRCGFYYDEYKQNIKPSPIFCDVCNWIIKFFNINIGDFK